MFLRLYSGADSQSHFEDMELTGDMSVHSAMEITPGVNFCRFPVDYFSDWHTAPRRQYIAVLSGIMEIGIGDGGKRQLGPGDVLLVEDLEGRGHTTRTVGDEPRVSLTIPISTWAPWLPAARVWSNL